jgi:hypothetical protein
MTFRKLDLFPSSGEEKNQILLGPLERASLNHWTMDKVRKRNISESYTPSSESYSNYYVCLYQNPSPV